ncbi:MAG TPA: hypothetical protein VFW66_12985 [Gemmatimonadales bacterium]|nr:hypothetical protein [Gemmatimonadales bacterium]
MTGFALASVSASLDHTCGVDKSGRAFCWGANTFGKLGDGTLHDRTTPVPVLGGLRFQSVSAGAFLTCGVLQDGRIACWGRNTRGHAGNGTTTASIVPVAVSGGNAFTSVSVSATFPPPAANGDGGSHTCGITQSAQALCWGNNDAGQVGDGSTTERRTPAAVEGGHAFTAISTGAKHTCGLTKAGRALCWGAGALGNGSAATTSPVAVSGDYALSAIASGSDFSCGVVKGGDQVICWDQNPPTVRSGFTASAISAGAGHVCGASARGTWCSGRNDRGQLGNGTSFDTPGVVPVSLSQGLRGISNASDSSKLASPGLLASAFASWLLRTSLAISRRAGRPHHSLPIRATQRRPRRGYSAAT